MPGLGEHRILFTKTMIYNEQYFITASLGDVYPQNIRVCVVDPTQRTTSFDGARQKNVNNPYNCADVVPGIIPGDGAGNSCGRIGGLLYSGPTVALIYARKPCNIISYDKTNEISTDNEIGLITFNIANGNVTNINKVKIINADQITGLRAAKYGNGIFITYIINNSTSSSNSFNLQYIVGDTSAGEYHFAMLVDFSGNIITQPFVYDGNPNVSPSDELRVLLDGTVVWSFIGLDNTLSLYYLQAPPANKTIITTPVMEDGLLAISGSVYTGAPAYYYSSSFIEMYTKTKKNFLRK